MAMKEDILEVDSKYSQIEYTVTYNQDIIENVWSTKSLRSEILDSWIISKKSEIPSYGSPGKHWKVAQEKIPGKNSPPVFDE